jgi:phosphatidylglycerophosphate synthase
MAESGDRRPIAARELAITQRVAGWLILRGASADGISIAGMVAGLLAGLCLAAVAWTRLDAPFWLLGALFIQLRLLANMLDGMVAVGRGIASPAGELFNEVPDRVSDSATLIGLGIACDALALGTGAALAAMLTAYIRAVGKAAGAPSDFRGPMAKQQRMFLVTVVAVLCALLPEAWVATLPEVALWVILAGSLVTSWRRLAGSHRHLRLDR